MKMNQASKLFAASLLAFSCGTKTKEEQVVVENPKTKTELENEKKTSKELSNKVKKAEVDKKIQDANLTAVQADVAAKAVVIEALKKAVAAKAVTTGALTTPAGVVAANIDAKGVTDLVTYIANLKSGVIGDAEKALAKTPADKRTAARFQLDTEAANALVAAKAAKLVSDSSRAALVASDVALKNAQTELNTLTASVSVIKTKTEPQQKTLLADRNTSFNAASAASATAKTNSTNAELAVTVLNNEISSNKLKYEGSKLLIAQLQEKLVGKDGKTGLQEKLAVAIKSAVVADVAAVKLEIDNVNIQKNEEEKQFAELSKLVTTSEAAKVELVKKAVASKLALTTADAALAKAKADLDTVNAQITKLGGELTGLNTKVAAVKNSISTTLQPAFNAATDKVKTDDTAFIAASRKQADLDLLVATFDKFLPTKK